MRGSKDAALGFALRVFLNARLGAIGEVTQLSVDTAEHSARLSIALRGEPDAVDVHVRRYALHEADGQNWLTLVDAAASREWLEALLHYAAIGRRFPIAANAAKVLRLLT